MLTFALIAACGGDDDETPKAAPIIPNDDAAFAPYDGARPDVEDASDDGVPTTNIVETAIVVGVEIDTTAIVADRWTIDVVAPDDPTFTPIHDAYAQEQTHELVIEQPFGGVVGDLQITVTGTNMLRDGTTFEVAKRVATKVSFSPGAKTLAYLYMDSGCAYGAHTCAAGGTCAEGACRSSDLTRLPLYSPSWRTSPPDPCLSDVAPVLFFGEGLDRFSARDDGDTMKLQCGSQGGNHLWIALRMAGLDRRHVSLTIHGSAVDGGVAYPTQVVRRFGACETLGVQFQLFAGPGSSSSGSVPATYLGQSLDIEVDADDGAGRKASVTKHIQIAPALDPTSCGAP